MQPERAPTRRHVLNILEILTREHDELRNAMTTLAAQGARTGEFLWFARDLEEHARLEDELLFVQLEETLPADVGPLPAMRAEHDQIDEGLARLGGLADTEPGWLPLLSQTFGLASLHFAKEERVLFPLASRQVPAERLEELGEKFVGARSIPRSPRGADPSG